MLLHKWFYPIGHVNKKADLEANLKLWANVSRIFQSKSTYLNISVPKVISLQAAEFSG